jgi:hypothetical protein
MAPFLHVYHFCAPNYYKSNKSLNFPGRIKKIGGFAARVPAETDGRFSR